MGYAARVWGLGFRSQNPMGYAAMVRGLGFRGLGVLGFKVYGLEET